jgi:hypothetical protein
MRIQGIEGMTRDQLKFELQRGGRLVLYYYCISLIIMTFRRPSGVYFLRAGENAVLKGMRWSVLTLLLGWWGIPWGPIYSVQSLAVNLGGGKDITAEVLTGL